MERIQLTPKTIPTVFLGSGMTTTVALLGPFALERSILRRTGWVSRAGMLRIREGVKETIMKVLRHFIQQGLCLSTK